MLACDGSVTTAWACANEKRTPAAASASMLGVRAGPSYELRASPRSVSTVTRRTFCCGSTARASLPAGPRTPQYSAPTSPAARATVATATRLRLFAGDGPTGTWPLGGLRRLATVSLSPKSWIQSVQVYRNRTQLPLIHHVNTHRLVPAAGHSVAFVFVCKTRRSAGRPPRRMYEEWRSADRCARLSPAPCRPAGDGAGEHGRNLREGRGQHRRRAPGCLGDPERFVADPADRRRDDGNGRLSFPTHPHRHLHSVVRACRFQEIRA